MELIEVETIPTLVNDSFKFKIESENMHLSIKNSYFLIPVSEKDLFNDISVFNKDGINLVANSPKWLIKDGKFYSQLKFFTMPQTIPIPITGPLYFYLSFPNKYTVSKDIKFIGSYIKVDNDYNERLKKIIN